MSNTDFTRQREEDQRQQEEHRRGVEENYLHTDAAPDDDYTGDQRGGEDRRPVGDQRADRDQTHGQLTPAEEREVMMKRLREKRSVERIDMEGSEDPRDVELFSRERPDDDRVQRQEGDDELPPDPNQPQNQQQPQGQGRKFTLRVNNRPVEVDEAELIRRAQMGMASEHVLTEAKATIEDARRVRQEALADAERIRQEARSGRLADSETHAEDDAEPGQRRGPKPTDRAKLLPVVEALQTGDAEDAVEAFSGLIEEIRREQPDEGSGLSPDQVAHAAVGIINERMADQQFRGYFAGKHPELVGRRGLQMELQDQFHREMVGELMSLVRDDGHMLTDAELAPAARDPKIALKWLTQYSEQGVRRQDGNAIGNPIELMDRAAISVKREFGLDRRQPNPPANQQRNQGIREQKRMLSEPRPATGARQGQQPQQRLTPQQSRSSAVAQRREASGFVDHRR